MLDSIANGYSPDRKKKKKKNGYSEEYLRPVPCAKWVK